MPARIRTQDEVVVTTGRDKGKRGRVLSILTKKGKVVVEGVNIVTRHLKRNPANPAAGGRTEKPAPIPMSKVMLWSPSDSKGVRVRMSGTGREKHRVAASKSNSRLGADTVRRGKGKGKGE